MEVHTCGFAASRADQHDIRNRDRCFKFNDPRTDRPASLSFDLFLVLLAQVYSLHDQALIIRNYTNNQPAFSLIYQAAADYLDRITFANFYSHLDRKSTRLNSSHGYISYAVFCLKKKK